MKKSEQINFLRIALNLQKIGVNNETADRIIETYERVLLKRGDFTIKDAIEIEPQINKKYSELNITAKKEK